MAGFIISGAATADVTNLLRNIQRMTNSLRRAQEAAEDLNRILNSLHSRDVHIALRFTGRVELKQLRDDLNRLRDYNFLVRVKLVGGAAIRQLRDDLAWLTSRRHTVTIHARLDDDITVRINNIVNGINQLNNVAGNASGPSGGMPGLGKVIAALVPVIMSALPALGAFAPMLLGLAGAGGVVALSFEGIKKEASKLKPEFDKLKKSTTTAIMPGIKVGLEGLRNLMPLVTKHTKSFAETLGELSAKAGEAMKSPVFQKTLAKNLELGNQWVKEFGISLGRFGNAFLEFGAKSKPTLDALGGGLNDLIGKSFPSMFKELEVGIKGSAEMFDGFFSLLHDLLVGLGKLSASVANTFGPVFGAAFETIGKVFRIIADNLAPAIDELAPLGRAFAGVLKELPGVIEPVVRLIGFGLVGALKIVVPIWQSFLMVLRPLIRTIGEVADVIATSLIGSLKEVGPSSNPLKRLVEFVKENKTTIEEAFRKGGDAVIEFAADAGEAAPGIVAAFRNMTEIILDLFGAILTGASKALGWIPGLGPKIKTAAKDFELFKDVTVSALKKAEEQAVKFAESVAPRLRQNRLEMNIKNWEQNIKKAKAQINDPKIPKEKKATLKADIKDWAAKIRDADSKLLNLRNEKIANLKGDIKDWNSKIDRAQDKLRRMKPTEKTGKVLGDIKDLQRKVDAAQRKINSLRGKRVTSTHTMNTIRNFYTNNIIRTSRRNVGPTGEYASGGLIKGFAGGGIPSFPKGGFLNFLKGGERQDANLIAASKNEFMVNADSVRHYGVPFMEAINKKRFPKIDGVGSSTPSGSGGGSSSTGHQVIFESGAIQINNPVPETAGTTLHRTMTSIRRFGILEV